MDPGDLVERHSDKDLAARVLAGDQRAFDDLFNQYFDRLYRFALGRLRHDPTAAEDVVQQTLCKAIEKLGSYRGEAALFTWLCQICRNLITDSYRVREREVQRSVVFEDSEEIRTALELLGAPDLEDPELAAQRSEVGKLVQLVLDYLPDHYGDVLEWKYVQGMSVSEIATRLELGNKAAESLLTRARDAFRQGFTSLRGSASIMGIES
jgi:RNA polymerase sigma-70 factor (ECF subfamily)